MDSVSSDDGTAAGVCFGHLTGTSEGMREVCRLIRKAAPSDITVLIEGESGSGKELAAQLIHALSHRAPKPLCAVNCAAIAQNLIASELFGHEHGSFTGATRNHRGYFERASGGTLFLDEITEMPLDLQSNLLRVLETGRILRVGGSEEITIDVRIIAATNRPAQEAVHKGCLREDLYYRLNGFPIRIPPLRERGDEIIALAQHFLALANADHGSAKYLSPAAEQALLAYAWPGNVRELRNTMTRAALLAETCINVADLSLEQPKATGVQITGNSNSSVATPPTTSKLREVEKQLILDTLSACAGNKQRTAQQLGISLKTLYNKLKEYAGNEDNDRRSDNNDRRNDPAQ
jgi:DNA-binding NtrC family response regulator